jgi:hypothetical protein
VLLVIPGVIKDSKVYTDIMMSAEFAQACDFKFATLKWFAPVPGPGLGPELCHDRGHALPHPGLAEVVDRDCVGVTVALGVTSVIVSGLAYGRCHGTTRRAPLCQWPLSDESESPSTDTRVLVVSVVFKLRVIVLRSTHN